MAVAVGIFRDEQIVANQKRRLHRSRGDVEGLKQESADHQRDQESVEDDAEGFAQTAFSFCSGCHAHCFPSSRLSQFAARIRARWQSIFLTRIALCFASRKCPDSDIESQSRRKPE